ncbi:hypothetical protein NDCJBJIB_03108 [Mannheimia haemolytica]
MDRDCGLQSSMFIAVLNTFKGDVLPFGLNDLRKSKVNIIGLT